VNRRGVEAQSIAFGGVRRQVRNGELVGVSPRDVAGRVLVDEQVAEDDPAATDG
jgi:hypothetical protein